MPFPLIAAGVALLGAGVSAYGQYEQGEEAKRAAARQARLGRLAAEDAIRRGAIEAGNARIAGTQTIGQQKAILGASGVDVSSGSPLALMADTRALSELDAQTIKNNAAREAWGHRTGAAQAQAQGAAAASAGKLGAGGTLLGGAANFASMGYQSGWFGLGGGK